MKPALAAASLCLFVLSASAAELGPASQTLEALRGDATSDPDRFFDGLDARVTSPTPVFYEPLPSEPLARAGDILFDSHRIAPGLTLHEPLPAAGRTSSASASASTVVLFVLGAALVAGAVLLLLLL